MQSIEYNYGQNQHIGISLKEEKHELTQLRIVFFGSGRKLSQGAETHLLNNHIDFFPSFGKNTLIILTDMMLWQYQMILFATVTAPCLGRTITSLVPTD